MIYVSRPEACFPVTLTPLGPERFLKIYAEGSERFGYENSPLEKVAYEAEDLFKRGRPVFDAKQFVTAPGGLGMVGRLLVSIILRGR